MAEIKIDGFREIDAVLDNLPRQLRKSAMLAAGRKAARPMLTRARQIIKTTSTDTEGNLDGFRHLQALAKATKVETYKGTVFIRVSQRFPDLPMASKRPFWTVRPASFLFAFGRQNEGKGTRKKATGYTKGFGDWIEQALKERSMYARSIYRNTIENETIKAISRTVTKYGKRY